MYDTSCGFFGRCSLSGRGSSPLFQFSDSFYSAWVLNIISVFFCTNWYKHLLFILQPLNMVDSLISFEILQPMLYSWNKPHLVMCIILYICCQIVFANFLLRIFVSMRECTLYVSIFFLILFFSVLSLWFWFQNNISFLKWVDRYSLILYFLEESYRIGINSS